ncbi:hypothetical protein ElyMa_004153500 [Elysia marginata]|uniref:Uncharacterized protein n=1 Tax=Elysia marginata TaxID=1093978 RepID=A0AAV4GHK4_9GAST|nr:hypothetical protein ElyMa_004153500 [Elysia marginata]
MSEEGLNEVIELIKSLDLRLKSLEGKIEDSNLRNTLNEHLDLDVEGHRPNDRDPETSGGAESRPEHTQAAKHSEQTRVHNIDSATAAYSAQDVLKQYEHL